MGVGTCTTTLHFLFPNHYMESKDSTVHTPFFSTSNRVAPSQVEALEKATIPTPTLMAMERVENQVTALGHRVDSLAESMEKLMTVVAGQAKSESS